MVNRRSLFAVGASALLLPRFLRAAELQHDQNEWAKPRLKNRLSLRLSPSSTIADVVPILSAFDASVKMFYPIENLYVIETTSDDIEALATRLEGSGFADAVYPDLLHSVKAIPNDPYYASGPQTNLSVINGPAAWDLQKLANLTVVVPVVDINTGVLTTHPDLSANILTGYNALTGLSDVTDTYGHGTWCASPICAVTNNGAGVAGVGWGGKLIPIKVATGASFASSDILNGLTWVAANVTPPAVINMSFSGAPDYSYASTLQYLWNANFMLFGSSGNLGSTPCDVGPIDSPYVMGVASCSYSLGREGYSSYGPSSAGSGVGALISAPGGDGSNLFYTTDLGNGYTGVWGTSVSTPTVAAAMAFCWSSRLSLTVQDLWSILTNPANNQATTGFGTSPAPCIDLLALYNATQTYTPRSRGGSSPLMRR
jgi:subtilisin family serine protease